MGSTLYWVSTDMHGPRYGWSMRQASAMLLVPDIPLTDKNSKKSLYLNFTLALLALHFNILPLDLNLL